MSVWSVKFEAFLLQFGTFFTVYKTESKEFGSDQYNDYPISYLLLQISLEVHFKPERKATEVVMPLLVLILYDCSFTYFI